MGENRPIEKDVDTDGPARADATLGAPPTNRAQAPDAREVAPEVTFAIHLSDDDRGRRLDKVMTERADPSFGLSRSRLRDLMEAGRVRLDGRALRDPSQKVGDALLAASPVQVTPPPPALCAPQPENVSLDVVYEDAHLIVVNKPPGMAAHPSPGSETGTLVNALLHHCGDSLSGVGGVARPGVVHRLDKDTSGVLVAAKTDMAHQGLAAQFAAHDVDRAYLALVWGAPDRGDPRLLGLPAVSVDGGALKINAPLGRHPSDRKRMGVAKAGAPGARRAVTRLWVRSAYGLDGARVVTRIECRLETGRTHQIRAHLSHIGHPIVGDPIYGRPRAIRSGALPAAAVDAAQQFSRQALHAYRLGFRHPVDGRVLSFERPPPADFTALLTALAPAAH